MRPFAGKATKDERRLFLLDERDEAEEKGARQIRKGLRVQFEHLRGSVKTPADDVLAALQVLNTASGDVRTAIMSVLLRGVEIGGDAGENHLAEYALAVDRAESLAGASEWARKRTAEAMTQINATTTRNVQAAVTAWRESGAPVDDLWRQLALNFGQERADMIARTETTAGFVEGYQMILLPAGAREMEWYTMQDERVCPVCKPMHGATRFIDGLYASEMILAGGVRQPPPAHPRCRCGERGLIGEIGE